jgi:hypothetical protein
MMLMIVALFPAVVSAHQLDGNQLFELCSGDDQICTGYVMGVADARDGDSHGIQFCIPDGVPRAQLREIVVTYLRNSPKRSFPASIMVSGALAEKFQCRN